MELGTIGEILVAVIMIVTVTGVLLGYLDVVRDWIIGRRNKPDS